MSIEASQFIVGASSILFFYWWKLHRDYQRREQELKELRLVVNQLREEVESLRHLLNRKRRVISTFISPRLKTGYELVQKISSQPHVEK